MKWIDIIRMAIGNLKRNRMRTVLTVSGVVVGIGAIVFLVSIGFGLQNLMVSKVANLEALTVITVRPGNKEGHGFCEATKIKWAGNEREPLARETFTNPSSSGCLKTSKTDRENSGNSSKNNTPRWARVISPGLGHLPPPTRAISDEV